MPVIPERVALFAAVVRDAIRQILVRLLATEALWRDAHARGDAFPALAWLRESARCSVALMRISLLVEHMEAPDA